MESLENKQLRMTDLESMFNQAIGFGSNYIGIKISYPNLFEPKIEIYSNKDFLNVLETYRTMYSNSLTYIECDDIKIVGFEYGNSFQEIEDWLND